LFAAGIGALVGMLATASTARADGWGDWWLPTNYSEHGGGFDTLFVWIFWITMITFVLVEVVLVIFLIKYRARPERKKATFTHGNTRLEMCWTLAPAVILAVLALASKQAWDKYKFPAETGEEPARVLVIGQQFKWNIVYPGPDGKIGRYLVFPKPTDMKWPSSDGKPVKFSGVDGPGFLKYEDAVSTINKYIAQENPLGKDFSDPDGKDDDWSKTAGRAMFLPANTPIEIQLGSKDVIHDFFLPNFRVKLDAVPGLRGMIHFKSLKQSTETFDLANVPNDAAIWLDRDTKAAVLGGTPAEFEIPHPTEKVRAGGRMRSVAIIRNMESLKDAATKRVMRRDKVAADKVEAAKVEAEIAIVRQELTSLGIMQLTAITHPFELVCEELCGGQHYTMRGVVTMLSPDQYQKFINKSAPATAAADTTTAADELSSAR
jgi:heme/copper-type cytochrome/quinol oxidase subunit 2